MSSLVAERRLSIELAAGPGQEPIAAYSDVALDYVTRLGVSRSNGKLSAEAFIDGQRVVIRCGQISMEQVSRLEGAKTLLWVRMEGEKMIAVAEKSLELI